jgi:hypothetical protein
MGATMPPSPTAEHRTSSAFQPHELNPELAAAKLAEKLVDRMGDPTVVSKRFVVWQGIWEGLNHTKENPTGYDCSMRVALYRHIAKNSVNIDGKYFDRLFAYLMKPKYTIVQNTGQPGNAFQEDEPGFFRGLFNRLTGQGKKQEEPQNANS